MRKQSIRTFDLVLLLAAALSAQTAYLDLGYTGQTLTLPVDTLWRVVKMPARDLGMIDSLPPPALAVQLPNDNTNQIRYHFDEFSLIPGQVIDFADTGVYSMEVNSANDSLSVDADTPYPGGTAGLTYFNNPGDANSGFQLILNSPGTVPLTAYDTLQVAVYASAISDLRKFWPLAVGNTWLFTYMGNTTRSHYWEQVTARSDSMVNGNTRYDFRIHWRELSRPEYGGETTEGDYHAILYANNLGTVYLAGGADSLVFTGDYMWPFNTWHQTYTSSTYYESPAFSLGYDYAGSGRTWAYGIGEVVESLDGAGFKYLTGYTVNGETVGDVTFPVGIEPEPTVPATFNLKCYPNPFNPSTSIQFSLPRSEMVSVSIYNVTGRLVSKLADHEPFQAGQYARVWTPDGQAGGIYFVRIIAGNRFQTQKLVLLK